MCYWWATLRLIMLVFISGGFRWQRNIPVCGLQFPGEGVSQLCLLFVEFLISSVQRLHGNWVWEDYRKKTTTTRKSVTLKRQRRWEVVGRGRIQILCSCTYRHAIVSLLYKLTTCMCTRLLFGLALANKIASKSHRSTFPSYHLCSMYLPYQNVNFF